jgi:LAS superfamily LD-carboxypeptidase LdcB
MTNNPHLFGKACSHLVNYTAESCQLHPLALENYLKLQRALAVEGVDLKIASAFRSYDRQQLIWNEKVAGTRPVLDHSGKPLDPKSLTEEALVYAILRWSALPGASRHHWGTDIDVYDAAAIPANYRVQLTSEEYGDKGPFARLNDCLVNREAQGLSFGFARVYAEDRGGVAPEPWHLSYLPVAQEYQRQLSYDQLEACINSSEMELKRVIIEHLPDIYSRFVEVSY